MTLFGKKSTNIRARVLDHIEPLIKQGEDEHKKNVQKAHEEYVNTIETASSIRDSKKEASVDAIVKKIVEK